MKRIPLTPEEQDALTPWRRFIKWRTGQVAVIKRRYRRRERHQAKHGIWKEKE
jgi:hypothetical protein